MQAINSAAVLIGALALLAAALPDVAAARTSAAPMRQQEPTGFLGPDEAREGARVLDKAQLGIGHTIHADVVVDRNGRRVSSDWYAPVSPEGVGYATEPPIPVLAEDVNAPDGIVVLVDPFRGEGSFVEAPGLSDRDKRHLSGLMTDRFRRGSYGDGLVAVAHGIEQRLAPPRPASLAPDHAHRNPSPGREVSGAAVALFIGGIAAVSLLLGHFLSGERYRRPQGPEKGVGFVAARRDAEALLSGLAPKVLLLAERELGVIGRLRDRGEGEPNGPSRRRRAEGLLRQAVPGGFWESFVAATALVERDPEKALAELRRLSAQAEAALHKLGEAERTLRDPRADRGPDDGEERLTRGERNDG